MAESSGGSVSARTAKLWFCEVICTLPVASSFTGWLHPWCPNASLHVFAPQARASSWWPRQMPMTGGRGPPVMGVTSDE